LYNLTDLAAFNEYAFDYLLISFHINYSFYLSPAYTSGAILVTVVFRLIKGFYLFKKQRK